MRPAREVAVDRAGRRLARGHRVDQQPRAVGQVARPRRRPERWSPGVAGSTLGQPGRNCSMSAPPSCEEGQVGRLADRQQHACRRGPLAGRRRRRPGRSAGSRRRPAVHRRKRTPVHRARPRPAGSRPVPSRSAARCLPRRPRRSPACRPASPPASPARPGAPGRVPGQPRRRAGRVVGDLAQHGAGHVVGHVAAADDHDLAAEVQRARRAPPRAAGRRRRRRRGPRSPGSPRARERLAPTAMITAA